jgi:hypothetical protein
MESFDLVSTPAPAGRDVVGAKGVVKPSKSQSLPTIVLAWDGCVCTKPSLTGVRSFASVG